MRYAHPFFTATPPVRRPVDPALHARRMSEVIQAKMGPIPPPRGTPTMQLVDIIGKQGVGEITAAGKIRFHSVGDTGRPGGADAAQEDVTNAMTSNYNPSTPGDNPAFFLHLGDVIYGHDKEQLYRDEFYRPYMKYPGKILAIGGNHDGESDPPHPKPLSAFLANFCATSAVVPPAADNVRIFRQTMTQPGVYWLLQAPFVNMIGLYSNIAEGPGDLLGTNRDDKQIQWLKKTLADLKKAKDGGDKAALVIATHHPPFSEGGNGGSPVMLTQIDDACTGAGIIPHAMLAGHSHNYQRYTRTVRFGAVTGEIAYVVAGCGGHAASQVATATGGDVGNGAIFKKSLRGYGYLLLTVDSNQLVIEMFDTTSGTKRPFDKATVNLATHKVTP